MPMPLGVRLMPGERWSNRYPGHIRRKDGSLRKRMQTASGNKLNLYFEERSCEVCASSFLASAPNVNRGGGRFCSVACTSVGNSKPDGYRRLKRPSGGHVMVKAAEHPSANRQGMVPEHRFVMEREIGRRLLSDERVHHINMVPGDNRPENLHLFKNNAAHHRSHGTLNALVRSLMDAGVVEFDADTESYRLAAGFYQLAQSTEQAARAA